MVNDFIQNQSVILKKAMQISASQDRSINDGHQP